MASLTAHLRRPDDHGRLGFHPECPMCRRERLAGAPPADAIVSPRSQALLAASVLALSSASPAAVFAADPDQEHEGATAPEQVADDQAQTAPAFDPGGQSTELRFDAGPPPEANAAPDPTGDADPLEQEPAADESAPLADGGDGTGTESVGTPPEPQASDSVPPPAAEPAAPEPPSLSAPSAAVQEAPMATHHGPQADSAPPPSAHEPEREADATPPPRATKPEAAEPRSAEVAPTQTNVATSPSEPGPILVPGGARNSTTVRLAQGPATHRDDAQQSDRFHVVQRGESLWSIAKDLLGENASVARIAREVNRLWELNSARIGTGEPDLLMAGTRIALR